MSSPMFDSLEDAVARLREQGELLRTFQADMATHTTTVVSKNRMVSATVGATGRLTALAIKGNRYRSIPPAELASVVMDTVNAALEKASAAAFEAAKGLLPPGFDFDSIKLDGFDVDEFMRSTMERADESLPIQWARRTEGGQ